MTIEQKYNELRKTALELRALAKASYDEVSRERLCDYRDRVAKRATEIAASDWPSVRADYARAGEALPPGPPEFGTSGYSYHQYPLVTLSVSRVLGGRESRPYVADAEASLAPEIEREARAAEDAFERYRRAVEQGVAVDPDEQSEE